MLFMTRCRNVRVTVIAVKRLTSTPMANVRAKPLTILAPKLDPNQNRITHVMSVEAFESRMDGQARAKFGSSKVHVRTDTKPSAQKPIGKTRCGNPLFAAFDPQAATCR